MQLENKVAIVTGASSGIGAAAAKLFARNGARVVLGARRRDLLNEVVEAIARNEGEAVALAGDVADEDYAKELVRLAARTYGGLDVAFNNAGTLGATGDAASMASADWLRTIETNLTAGFYGAKHQIPAMLERGAGSLVFTSSFVGHTIGIPGMAAYGGSKAGLIGLTRCLAAELGPRGIRVNALLPGGTMTAMVDEFTGGDPANIEGVKQLHALKRIADPGEIARAALFLVSDASSFVTGTAMVVDGGNSISKG